MKNIDEVATMLKDVPLWVLEDIVKERQYDMEHICEECESLKDALDTGVNSIRLIIDPDAPAEYVGCKNLDGTYDVCEPFSVKMINTYPVKFIELRNDDDGYTIAIFEAGEDD